MTTVWHDFRYALRQLRNAPAFAVTAIFTLALGIGANTAIFSLLDQALLRSLPVHDPRSLVVLEGTGKAWEGHASSWGGDPEAYFSYPMYKDLRDQNRAFDGLVAISYASAGFTRGNSAQIVDTELVSGNYFTMLGVQPALGRVFTQVEDTQPGANPVAVLSYDYWRAHLGADPRIAGETVSINGRPFQILGVSSKGFESAVWGEKPAIFVPISMIGAIRPGKEGRLTDHRDKWLNIIGRLRPGVSRAQAEVGVASLWHALRAEELKAFGTRSRRFIDDYLTNSRLHVLPGARGFSFARENYEKPLLAVMAMAALVLLIATVNVASLLLVRSAGRVREFSLRIAIGAQTSRIVQQLLMEGLLVGIGGGIAGVFLASVAVRLLVQRLTTADGAISFNSAVDSRLLLFNFAVALAVSIFFSLAPALQLRRPDLTLAMGQRSATGSGHTLSFRRLVVCLQIGLSVLLLVGAGLFVRTMQKLRTINVGFNTTHLVAFGIDPKLAGYNGASVPALRQQVLETLAALPGITSVGGTTDPELADNATGGNVTVQGYTPGPEEDTNVEQAFISPAYFSTMQIPLLTGRAFSESDDAAHPMAAIVNEAFAKHYCQGAASCRGRRIGSGGGDNVKLDIEIVGVVRNNKHSGLRDDVVPTLFRPLKQQPDPANVYLYLRTASDPELAISTVRRTMQQLNPKLALQSLRTMDEQIDDDLSNDRMVMLLAVSFGALAALLAGVGIYGVLAYSTTQRTREIGIRIALGSSRLGVARIILADVLLLAVIGIVIAVPAAYGLSHLVQSQLYGVKPADPLTLIAAVLLIACVAVIAALIPAQRAATVDPMQALRTE